MQRDLIVYARQPDLVPWFNFFLRAHMSDVVIIMDHVQYNRRSMQNRFDIGVNENGQKIWCTVPVNKAPQSTAIDDIYISDSFDHQDIINKVTNQFRHCEHLTEVTTWLNVMFSYMPTRRLADVSYTLIASLLRVCGAQCTLVRSSEMDIDLSAWKKGDLIKKMCEYYGATEYICGQGSIGYLDSRLMEPTGIHYVPAVTPSSKTDYDLNEGLIGYLCKNGFEKFSDEIKNKRKGYTGRKKHAGRPGS